MHLSNNATSNIELALQYLEMIKVEGDRKKIFKQSDFLEYSHKICLTSILISNLVILQQIYLIAKRKLPIRNLSLNK